LTDIVRGIHILPFYPWTSDDGFSVVDYRQIDPALGDWDDVSAMQNFRLMFDAVINHISSQSEWFQRFLQDDSRYCDYFITVEGEPNLSQVVRPRALPLLTLFPTPSGEKKVWTTFSADQVYAIAELIRRQRGGTAIVMGALSPRTRNAQVEMFQSGELQQLVGAPIEEKGA